jgi:hypothetical protein
MKHTNLFDEIICKGKETWTEYFIVSFTFLVGLIGFLTIIKMVLAVFGITEIDAR